MFVQALEAAPAREAMTWIAVLLLRWCLYAVLTDPAAAVDASKYRTCEQGSFCRRYRKYVSKVEKSGGSDFAHALDETSVTVSSNAVAAKLLFVNDPTSKPLLLQLKWFKTADRERCGIIRLRIDEENPLHERFELQEGDVVMKEADLTPDELKLEHPSYEEVRIVSLSAGDCSIKMRHRPFELEFSAGGRLLQRLNSRHLLNFERYRHGGSAESYGRGLTDATDVDNSNLWAEGFAGHHDSKPRGPAAVAIDVSFESAPEIFGLAEHATGINLGENSFDEPYRFYNLDVFEYAMDVPSGLYGAVPLATAVHRWSDGTDTRATASGFFFPNPSEGFVKVDGPKKAGWFSTATPDNSTKTWWLFESGVMDMWLFAGPTPHAVLQQYHTVTGLPRLPPLCTLGKHQSRWNYVDVADSVGVNKKFDQHDIPYDVLWLDIEHTDGKKYFTWHPSHFDKPEVLLDALAKDKRKLVTIIDPHIKKEGGYKVYETLRDSDLLTKTKNNDQFEGWCWPGTSTYADFCNPDMREKWATFFLPENYPHSRPDLYTWNDMNEPSVFNGPEVSMPRDNLHKCHKGSYEVEHRDVHNVYGFYHHMATVQGQLKRAPDVRPFVLTRSFFAGSHRHGAVWTGDNMARWDHLARSVPMLVTLCLCGISFSGADVPGFFYDPEPELFRRWHQLGIWYPFYRGHAHLETKRREPWTFGDQVTAMIREQVTARYQLMPTWYTLFAEWAMAAWPILRPTWYHDIDDAEAFKYTDNQFLVGEAILVRAIEKSGMRSADVYFPKGEWFDYWNGLAAPQVGGKVMSVTLSDGHVPVFVRKGHILFKRMRRRRSTGAMSADPYSVFVFGDQAKGRLYVDDGHSHAYQKGAFLYEEFEFDGVFLRERPAPSLPNAPEAHGASEMEARQRRIERVVFVGLKRQPRLVHGASEDLQVTSVQDDAGGWMATVKKPTGLLGETWQLELVY